MDTLKRRSQEKILLTKCIENGVYFVVDNTNPTVEDRQRYFDILKMGVMKFMDIISNHQLKIVFQEIPKERAELAFRM